ncbi:MAG: thiamine diphosphokinase, partial [Kiritimatiellae bacterium]|nr:thiamine diphosphokinase [Kiritimatiellia bacterium]
WCRQKGWRRLAAVGATGRREDHSLGNVFRALDLGVEVVTDHGRFVPVAARAAFRVARGTPVSVFAPEAGTRMTSVGLKWPLDRVRFGNLYCATLNQAVRARVEVTTTRPVMVYLAS